jgi:hypothetical protein
MKQTAVEWLAQQILKHDKSFVEFYNAEIQQAKEMEKQQIIEAHGLIAKLQEDGSHKLISGETYYNETYKTDY